MMTFSISFPGIIEVLKNAGEFLRDTATVNIIDVDCKRQMYMHFFRYGVYTQPQFFSL